MREVREMTLWDWYDLADHWRKYPPTYLAVRRIESILRAYLGIALDDEPAPAPEIPADKELTDADVKQMVSWLNAQAPRIAGKN